MKILQAYITRYLLRYTLIAVTVLVAIFAFFSLIDQLEETNRGSYGVLQAAMYVALTIPRLAYELFPIAAMIGAMAALGMLAQNSELDIIRTSGMSRPELGGLLIRSALILVLVALPIGELVAPYSEQTAQHRRSVALTDQITLQTRHGFWVRDGDSFINIRRVVEGNKLEEIYIYEFDQQSHLRSSIYAQQAEYTDAGWMLHDVKQTAIADNGASRQEHKQAVWEVSLDPEIVNLITIKPQHLPIWELYDYIQYLRSNSQNTVQYEQALYAKLIKPITVIVMIMLAVPLVKNNSRFTGIGQRVFIGALIGVVFHFAGLASSNLGVVHNLPPLLMVCLPTLLLLLIVQRLLTRY
ncbi:MAG: LPS export ABC transporter permease LptG [Gammaproteobacteria bacterium]